MSILDKNDGPQNEVLVLGIGNILYADEGFGPRAVEHFHRTYSPREGIQVADGGTLGNYLMNDIMNAKRLLVLDCCDFKREPGYMAVLRDDDVKAWQNTKISPHQTGINDLLFHAMLMGYEPEKLTVIGIQPENMEDYGGGLTPTLAKRVDEAVQWAAEELAQWGFPVTKRPEGEKVEPLMAECVEEDRYINERPSEEEAYRFGDERFVSRPAGKRTDFDF
ncbi:MAG: HyaD/HybD family hydrogenase maturation endopeptidase [Sutterella sp.]|nr:HyaD/HybD family hydrogenase maturation endopeptidase [Sutterella sp.]